jgi:3-deoxy-7-phosphoheptulonate synthase
MMLLPRRKSPPWSPESWRQKAAAQQAEYPDPAELARAVAELGALPPLVHYREIEALKAGLARAAEGQCFVLQGGDCAESFEDCGSDRILAKLTALLQMSLILRHGTGMPVLCLGRLAGQYAKPRSQSTETRNGVTLPAYRGDIINRIEFTRAGRVPDPSLLLRGYERSALTLNFVRTLAAWNFTDLHAIMDWQPELAGSSVHLRELTRILEVVKREMRIMDQDAGSFATAGRTGVYTSHEMLAFDYDLAQTRYVADRGWYNLTTHLPWIGVRTNAPDGAHVEYCRGIRNPIGIKVGPETTPERLTELLEILDPDNEPGRMLLIHRFGAGKVAHCLPSLIEAVHATDKSVTWLSDPMHGNTETTETGLKTRRFERILAEVSESFRIHHELGSVLGGVHLELTGENVTECIGGATRLAAEDLGRDYRSKVDPRLNYAQSMEMALEIALQVNKMAAPTPGSSVRRSSPSGERHHGAGSPGAPGWTATPG